MGWSARGHGRQKPPHLPTSDHPVTLYPEVCQGAIKTSRDKEIGLWYCLRAVNDKGDGVIEVSAAREKLQSIYSRSTFDRTLSIGRGTLWEITSNKLGASWINLKGLEKVCLALGVYPSSSVRVPLSTMKGYARRRAWFYAAMFPTKDHHKRLKPISRLAIAKATGIKPRTQRRYDLVAKVRRSPNFVVTRESVKYASVMEKGAPGEYRYLGENGEGLSPAWMIVEGKCRSYLKQRRLGNSYRTPAADSGRSLVRKVRRRLRERGGLFDGGLNRRFFEDARNLVKAHQRGECHQETMLRAHRGPGKSEWEVGLFCN